MARNLIDTELETLMERKFPDNLAALNELQRFRMFAAADGYRGRAINLTVKDEKIVQVGYGKKPELDFLFKKAEEKDPPKPPVLQVEFQHDIVEKPAEKPEPKKAKSSKEPEPKPLQRNGGPKPRALKREEKKGKNKKRKSRSSSGYKR